MRIRVTFFELQVSRRHNEQLARARAPDDSQEGEPRVVSGLALGEAAPKTDKGARRRDERRPTKEAG